MKRVSCTILNLLVVVVRFLNAKGLWNSAERLHPLQQSLKVQHFSQWRHPRHICKPSRRPKAESSWAVDPGKDQWVSTSWEAPLKTRRWNETQKNVNYCILCKKKKKKSIPGRGRLSKKEWNCSCLKTPWSYRIRPVPFARSSDIHENKDTVEGLRNRKGTQGTTCTCSVARLVFHTTQHLTWRWVKGPTASTTATNNSVKPNILKTTPDVSPFPTSSGGSW